MKHPLFVITSVYLSFVLRISASPIPASIIQERIDRAVPGDEVLIPAGDYEGTLKIKDGIIVRGEGDQLSVLDGQGAPIVVSMGKNTAIIGFHIRNGAILAHNQGNFFGVFECTLSAYRQQAIMVAGGSGAVAHNNIEGEANGTGILVANANPLIVNNRIANNQTGIQVTPNLIPTVSDNLFESNVVAIAAIGEGARAVLKRNLYIGNQTSNQGIATDQNGDSAKTSAEDYVLSRGSLTGAYRNLMRETFAAAVNDHPIILYDLQQEPGAFDAVGLFPWATFTLTASAADTRIESYQAFDLLTDRSLNAEYAQDHAARPSVRVVNPELTEKMRERYVLENRYLHLESYFDDPEGRRIFKRMTNVSRIELVIPKGFEVVACQPAGTLTSGADQRSVMVIDSMGETHIELILTRSR